MRGISKKLCPLLLARGIFFADKDYEKAKVGELSATTYHLEDMRKLVFKGK